LSSIINLGQASDELYVDQSSLNLTALTNFTYALNSVSFGQIKANKKGVTQQYFESTTSSYPVQFSVSFEGLGLPSPLFTQFAELLSKVEDDILCTQTAGGICTLTSACSSYSDLLYDFYFLLNFTSNTTSYVRIPVATFASNNAANQCEL
jgi:hypothetical protein